MAPHSSLLRTTALFLCLSTPALADLTAPQIWENWQARAVEMGQTMTAANQSLSNGTLTLTDVAIAMQITDGSANTTIPLITMAEQGDGTVMITTSPQFDLRVQTQVTLGEAMDMTMGIAAPGLITIASGTPDALSYAFSGPEMRVSAVSMTVDGAPADFDIAASLTNLAGTYAVIGNLAPQIDSSFSAHSMAVAMSGTDAENPGFGLTLNINYDTLTSVSAGSRSLMAVADPASLTTAGTSFTSSYAHGGGRMALSVIDPENGNFDWLSTTAAGQLSASIIDGVIDYSGTSTDLDVTLTGDALPFPELNAAMQQFGFGLKVPLAATDAPTDFGLQFNLGGLTMGDVLWSMIDPTGTLPRDPATLLVDLAGKARMLVNIADPVALESVEVPAELHALTVNALRLSLAGAELTGSGGFTFDNTDMITFRGLPAADGALDLQLVGGNGLLDRLVQMGLIPQDQAMGARMMLGLFATPTGDDTLTSRIQVTPDGAISANGQRLQ